MFLPVLNPGVPAHVVVPGLDAVVRGVHEVVGEDKAAGVHRHVVLDDRVPHQAPQLRNRTVGTQSGSI
jgi:hypothetical protein